MLTRKPRKGDIIEFPDPKDWRQHVNGKLDFDKMNYETLGVVSGFSERYPNICFCNHNPDKCFIWRQTEQKANKRIERFNHIARIKTDV